MELSWGSNGGGGFDEFPSDTGGIAMCNVLSELQYFSFSTTSVQL